MSITYPQYPLSNFPDSLDSVTRMSDVSATDLSAIQQYYTLFNSGQFTEANQVLIDNNLTNKIFTANSWNKLMDAVLAVEKTFGDDIEIRMEDFAKKIEDMVTLEGEYSAGTEYHKYDIVSYTVDGVALYFMAIGNTIGNAPTDTNYWIPFTVQGPVGASGVGLSMRGDWDSTVVYNQYETVSYTDNYDGSTYLYYSKEEEGQSGNQPRADDGTYNTTYWQRFLLIDASVESYDELIQTVDATTVNGKTLGQAIVLNAADVGATGAAVMLTGYNKDTDNTAVKETDSLNAALSKLENRMDEQDSEIDDKLERTIYEVIVPLYSAGTTSAWLDASGTADGTTAPFTQTITVTGMKSTDIPEMSRINSSSTLVLAQKIAEKKAFGTVDQIDSGNNSITLTCYKKRPTSGFAVRLVVDN